ncbi:MAG: hypothetical protein V3V36_01165 [Candidatus Hydrothermarchaeaceae archaeon]
MTVATLTSANFGSTSQTKRLLGDLIDRGLVERKWDGNIVKYKKKLEHKAR